MTDGSFCSHISWLTLASDLSGVKLEVTIKKKLKRTEDSEGVLPFS